MLSAPLTIWPRPAPMVKPGAKGLNPPAWKIAPTMTQMSASRDQPALLHRVFDELAHGRHLGLRGRAVRGLVSEDADEAHGLPALGGLA